MKPLVTLLWGAGGDFVKYINLVQAFELKGEIEVLGVTAADMPYKEIYGYQTFSKNKVSRLEVDLIIIMSDALYLEIENDIRGMGICADVISCGVLSVPGFGVKEYLCIKKDIPTFFSVNCWAGLLYHWLRLPFRSPTINMFITGKDFIKFLKEPGLYLDTELEFKRMRYDGYLDREYPVALCKDVELHFNHYNDFASAKAKWDERAARINWERVIVVMCTEDSGIAEEFSMLPYEKKMCFVPFDSDLDGVYKIEMAGWEGYFFEVVNGIVSGRYPYYDILGLAKGEVRKVVR